MKSGPLAPTHIEEYRRLSSCVVASAIETFHVRLPNTGFTNSSIKCVFRDRIPLVGYAATARIRSAETPMEGDGYCYDRTDWWQHILNTPEPRVVVEDMDEPPGLGAFIGEVNSGILRALGCVGLVTNGSVRDLNEIQQTGFQMFEGMVVSNSILIVDFANVLRSEGHRLRDAVVLACRIRLRPILMTSLATVVGLLPMAFKLETGSEAYAPLARAIIGGLLTSIALTIFIVPAAYLLMYRKRADSIEPPAPMGAH